MSGKGDSPRPSSVPKAVRDANWERTFGRYAEEHALAKRLAVDLRGVLAKLEDEPKRMTATECEASLVEMGKVWGREMDRIREMMQAPLLDALKRATPCHDFLPSTGSQDDDSPV
jgi:hypothetical protein